MILYIFKPNKFWADSQNQSIIILASNIADAQQLLHRACPKSYRVVLQEDEPEVHTMQEVFVLRDWFNIPKEHESRVVLFDYYE